MSALSAISNSRKVKRGCNFTNSERQTLLNIVNKYIEIIENKNTKSEFIKQKRETWHKVARRYNLVATSGLRTWKQLRHAYENIKQKLKKKNAIKSGSPNFVDIKQQYCSTQLKTEVSEDEIDYTSFDGSIIDEMEIKINAPSKCLDVLEMEYSSKQIGYTSCDSSIEEDDPGDVEVEIEPCFTLSMFLLKEMSKDEVEMEPSCSKESGNTELKIKKRETKGSKIKEEYFKMKLENARIQQRCILQREKKEKLKVYLLKLKIQRFVARK